MSRKIKVKVWHKKIKEFVSPSKFLVFSEDGELVNDDCIVLQYTGLKDKNGVEVFNGDKVHIFSEEFEIDSKEVVMFEKGCFCLDNGTKLFECAEICEVIGNIYEYKELIKEVK